MCKKFQVDISLELSLEYNQDHFFNRLVSYRDIT